MKPIYLRYSEAQLIAKARLAEEAGHPIATSGIWELVAQRRVVVGFE